MSQLLVVAGVVFGINLLPALAPPTWAVLVYFRITDNVPGVALILVGALSAAAGRYCLAIAFGRLGRWLPRKRRENLEALGTTITQSHGALAGLAVFALSPVPSNSLFEAAGLARVHLVPLVGAFFAGRLVSYSLYVAVASKVAGSVRDTITSGFTSPGAILLALLGFVIVLGVVFVNWIDVIDRVRAWNAHRRGMSPPPSIRSRLGDAQR